MLNSNLIKTRLNQVSGLQKRLETLIGRLGVDESNNDVLDYAKECTLNMTIALNDVINELGK